MSGSKPKPIIPGTHDWAPRLISVRDIDKILIEDIASRTGKPIGELIRDWAVAGAAREAKRLKINIGGKFS